MNVSVRPDREVLQDCPETTGLVVEVTVNAPKDEGTWTCAEPVRSLVPLTVTVNDVAAPGDTVDGLIEAVAVAAWAAGAARPRPVAAKAVVRAAMEDKRVVKVVASNGKHLDEPSSYSLVFSE